MNTLFEVAVTSRCVCARRSVFGRDNLILVVFGTVEPTMKSTVRLNGQCTLCVGFRA